VRDFCTHSQPARTSGRAVAVESGLQAAQMMVRLEQLGGKPQMQPFRLDRATL
jgi:hypothetical protein